MRQFKFSDKFIFPISSIKKREFFKLIKKIKTILDYGCGNGVWDNYNSNKKIYLYTSFIKYKINILIMIWIFIFYS